MRILAGGVYLLVSHLVLCEVISYALTAANGKESLKIKKKHNYDHNSSGLMCEFISVERGCGRLRNRLLTTSTGKKFCARYRNNQDLLRGEYLSYLTSVLLEMHNVPTIIPVQVTINSIMWSTIWFELKSAGWEANAIVTLTAWMNDLRPVVAPKCIQLLIPCDFGRQSNTKEDIQPDKQGSALLQWADLIVFDYLTGNLDRLVSHLYNEKWDVKSMTRSVHNLATYKGNLVFLDNESGFEHSYNLLSTYQHFHERLLQIICALKNQTRSRIEKLAKSRDLGAEFGQVNTFPNLISPLSENALATLKRRLQRVLDHLQTC